MVGIILYKNQANGKWQFKKIIENYKQLNIEVVKMKTDEVEFENGDLWYAIPFSLSVVGRRCNIAYVEWSISKQEIDTIIEPMLTLKPYTAIHIFY